MKTILQQFGKQIAVAVVVLAVLFFVKPSLVIGAAIGFVIGAVAANYFPALEARAEQFIETKLRKG